MSISPKMIDNHFHGGGGLSIDSLASDYLENKNQALSNLDILLAPHKASGTTHHYLSLVTAPLDLLEKRVSALSEIVSQREDILGIHLEANFISPKFKGAHNENYLCSPDLPITKSLIAAGKGRISQITIAPELSSSIDSIKYMADNGVIASIGHTDANYEQTLAGLEAGAKNFTHLFNAMNSINHRNPGPIIAAYDWYKAGKPLTVEIVNDGVHIADSVVKLAFDMFSDYEKGSTSVALITDAMEGTGAADGDYMIGDLPVIVKDGKALIAGTNTIAGSTLTLGIAKQRAYALGIPEDIIRNSLLQKIQA